MLSFLLIASLHRCHLEAMPFTGGCSGLMRQDLYAKTHRCHHPLSSIPEFRTFAFGHVSCLVPCFFFVETRAHEAGLAALPRFVEPGCGKGLPSGSRPSVPQRLCRSAAQPGAWEGPFPLPESSCSSEGAEGGGPGRRGPARRTDRRREAQARARGGGDGVVGCAGL